MLFICAPINTNDDSFVDKALQCHGTITFNFLFLSNKLDNASHRTNVEYIDEWETNDTEKPMASLDSKKDNRDSLKMKLLNGERRNVGWLVGFAIKRKTNIKFLIRILNS